MSLQLSATDSTITFSIFEYSLTNTCLSCETFNALILYIILVSRVQFIEHSLNKIYKLLLNMIFIIELIHRRITHTHTVTRARNKKNPRVLTKCTHRTCRYHMYHFVISYIFMNCSRGGDCQIILVDDIGRRIVGVMSLILICMK